MARKLAVAIIAAPLPAALLLAGYCALFAWIEDAHLIYFREELVALSSSRLTAFFDSLFFFYFCTLFIVCIVGIPLHTYATAKDRRGLPHYLALGALTGLVLLVSLMVRARYTTQPTLEPWEYLIGAVLGAAVGATSALSAWLIRRPDRDPPTEPAE